MGCGQPPFCSPSSLWDKRHFKAKISSPLSGRTGSFKVSDVLVGWRQADRKSGTYKKSLVPTLAKRAVDVPTRRHFSVRPRFSP